MAETRSMTKERQVNGRTKEGKESNREETGKNRDQLVTCVDREAANGLPPAELTQGAAAKPHVSDNNNNKNNKAMDSCGGRNQSSNTQVHNDNAGEVENDTVAAPNVCGEPFPGGDIDVDVDIAFDGGDTMNIRVGGKAMGVHDLVNILEENNLNGSDTNVDVAELSEEDNSIYHDDNLSGSGGSAVSINKKTFMEQSNDAKQTDLSLSHSMSPKEEGTPCESEMKSLPSHGAACPSPPSPPRGLSSTDSQLLTDITSVINADVAYSPADVDHREVDVMTASWPVAMVPDSDNVRNYQNTKLASTQDAVATALHPNTVTRLSLKSCVPGGNMFVFREIVERTEQMSLEDDVASLGQQERQANRTSPHQICQVSPTTSPSRRQRTSPTELSLVAGAENREQVETPFSNVSQDLGRTSEAYKAGRSQSPIRSATAQGTSHCKPSPKEPIAISDDDEEEIEVDAAPYLSPREIPAAALPCDLIYHSAARPSSSMAREKVVSPPPRNCASADGQPHYLIPTSAQNRTSRATADASREARGNTDNTELGDVGVECELDHGDDDDDGYYDDDEYTEDEDEEEIYVDGASDMPPDTYRLELFDNPSITSEDMQGYLVSKGSSNKRGRPKSVRPPRPQRPPRIRPRPEGGLNTNGGGRGQVQGRPLPACAGRGLVNSLRAGGDGLAATMRIPITLERVGHNVVSVNYQNLTPVATGPPAQTVAPPTPSPGSSMATASPPEPGQQSTKCAPGGNVPTFIAMSPEALSPLPGGGGTSKLDDWRLRQQREYQQYEKRHRQQQQQHQSSAYSPSASSAVSSPRTMSSYITSDSPSYARNTPQAPPGGKNRNSGGSNCSSTNKRNNCSDISSPLTPAMSSPTSTAQVPPEDSPSSPTSFSVAPSLQTDGPIRTTPGQEGRPAPYHPSFHPKHFLPTKNPPSYPTNPIAHSATKSPSPQWLQNIPVRPPPQEPQTYPIRNFPSNDVMNVPIVQQTETNMVANRLIGLENSKNESCRRWLDGNPDVDDAPPPSFIAMVNTDWHSGGQQDLGLRQDLSLLKPVGDVDEISEAAGYRAQVPYNPGQAFASVGTAPQRMMGYMPTRDEIHPNPAQEISQNVDVVEERGHQTSRKTTWQVQEGTADAQISGASQEHFINQIDVKGLISNVSLELGGYLNSQEAMSLENKKGEKNNSFNIYTSETSNQNADLCGPGQQNPNPAGSDTTNQVPRVKDLMESIATSDLPPEVINQIVMLLEQTQQLRNSEPVPHITDTSNRLQSSTNNLGVFPTSEGSHISSKVVGMQPAQGDVIPHQDEYTKANNQRQTSGSSISAASQVLAPPASCGVGEASTAQIPLNHIVGDRMLVQARVPRQLKRTAEAQDQTETTSPSGGIIEYPAASNQHFLQGSGQTPRMPFDQRPCQQAQETLIQPSQSVYRPERETLEGSYGTNSWCPPLRFPPQYSQICTSTAPEGNFVSPQTVPTQQPVRMISSPAVSQASSHQKKVIYTTVNQAEVLSSDFDMLSSASHTKLPNSPPGLAQSGALQERSNAASMGLNTVSVPTNHMYMNNLGTNPILQQQLQQTQLNQISQQQQQHFFSQLQQQQLCRQTALNPSLTNASDASMHSEENLSMFTSQPRSFANQSLTTQWVLQHSPQQQNCGIDVDKEDCQYGDEIILETGDSAVQLALQQRHMDRQLQQTSQENPCQKQRQSHPQQHHHQQQQYQYQQHKHQAWQHGHQQQQQQLSQNQQQGQQQHWQRNPQLKPMDTLYHEHSPSESKQLENAMVFETQQRQVQRPHIATQNTVHASNANISPQTFHSRGMPVGITHPLQLTKENLEILQAQTQPIRQAATHSKSSHSARRQSPKQTTHKQTYAPAPEDRQVRFIEANSISPVMMVSEDGGCDSGARIHRQYSGSIGDSASCGGGGAGESSSGVGSESGRPFQKAPSLVATDTRLKEWLRQQTGITNGNQDPTMQGIQTNQGQRPEQRHHHHHHGHQQPHQLQLQNKAQSRSQLQQHNLLHNHHHHHHQRTEQQQQQFIGYQQQQHLSQCPPGELTNLFANIQMQGSFTGVSQRPGNSSHAALHISEAQRVQTSPRDLVFSDEILQYLNAFENPGGDGFQPRGSAHDEPVPQTPKPDKYVIKSVTHQANDNNQGSRHRNSDSTSSQRSQKDIPRTQRDVVATAAQTIPYKAEDTKNHPPQPSKSNASAKNSAVVGSLEKAAAARGRTQAGDSDVSAITIGDSTSSSGGVDSRTFNLEPDNDGETCLHLLSVLKMPAELLTELAATPGFRRALDAKNIRGETPLFTAVCDGYVDGVEYLLSHGADPNILCLSSPMGFRSEQVQQTCLHEAVERGNVGVVRSLLANKHTQVDAPHRCTGKTPLMLALEVHISSNRSQIIMLLIGHKASLFSQHQISGETPLMLAILSQDVGLVEKLLCAAGTEHHRDLVTAKARKGLTCLHFAASLKRLNRKEKQRLLKILIGAGGEASEKNEEGETPKDWDRVNMEEVLTALKTSGQ